jgi:serine/threonine protein kinase
MFGQEQDFVYRAPSSKALPYKWMALESFGMRGSFTSKSDVWAFGIFLWELFEFGKIPYEGISDPQHLFNFLSIPENRLQAPTTAPDAVYSLMLEMWKEL